MPTLTQEQVKQALERGVSKEQIKKYMETGDATTAPKEKGFFQSEVTGETKKDVGILGSIFQSTIGSKGIMGVAQNLGKAFAQKDIAKSQEQVSQAQQNLSTATLNAIKARKAATNPERIAFYDRLIADNVKQLEELTGAQVDLTKYGLTQKQNLGTAFNAASTVALPGAGGGVIKTAIKTGAAGAVAGTGEALTENKSVAESLRTGFTTGLASAATAGVLSSITRLGSVALDKLPERIYASVAGLEKKAAKVMLNEKQVGSLARLKTVADKHISVLNKEIESKITPKSGEFNSKAFVKTVFDKIKNEWVGVDDKKIKAALRAADIEPFLKGKTVDYATADKIRQKIGETIGSVWKMENPKFNNDVRMTIWKEIVNTVRPITKTEKQFARLEAYMKASRRFAKVIENQEKKFGLKFTDLILGGFGYLGGGLPGAAIGGANMVARTPVARTGAAVGLNELNKILDKIPAKYFDAGGRITRASLIKALSEGVNIDNATE